MIIGKGGLYVNCFRLQPPMCVTLDDASFAVSVMEQVG